MAYILAPEPPHPHPAAPKEYQSSSFFTEFQKRIASFATQASTKSTATSTITTTTTSSTSTVGAGVYTEFWQAPSRIWKPRVHQLSEEEIEAVQVSLLD